MPCGGYTHGDHAFIVPEGSPWRSPRDEYIHTDTPPDLGDLALRWSITSERIFHDARRDDWRAARAIYQESRGRSLRKIATAAEAANVHDFTRWAFAQKIEAPRRHAHVARILLKHVEEALTNLDGSHRSVSPADLMRLSTALRIAVELERQALGLDRSNEGITPPGIEEFLGEPAPPGYSPTQPTYRILHK